MAIILQYINLTIPHAVQLKISTMLHVKYTLKNTYIENRRNELLSQKIRSLHGLYK